MTPPNPVALTARTSDFLAARSVGATSIRTSSEAVRIPALDGLRGCAILLVIFWHYYACVPRPEWLLQVPGWETVAAYGWTGVPLFFVLSGFLIGRILVAERGRKGYYATFFVRRAARILPLYFLCLALYALAHAALASPATEGTEGVFGSVGPFSSYFVFLQNFAMARAGSLGGHWLSVTWSLAVEEQFYLILPFVVAILRPTWLLRFMIGVVAASLLFRWLILNFALANAAAVMVLLPCRIDAFAIGILIGLVAQRGVSPRVTRWAAAVGLAVCIMTLVFARSSLPPYIASLYTLIAGAYGFVLLHVACSNRGRVGRLFSWAPLAWCGRVSYFVYLFHQPTNFLVHGLAHRTPQLGDGLGVALSVTALALVLALAELSRRYIEGPCLRYGRRWTYAAAETS